MIFVVGCGRTGTCMMGQILDSHSQVECFIEDERFFPLSTEMAVDPSKRSGLHVLIQRYRDATSEARFADKSHPNLWHAEALYEAFPEAQFVAMYRNVEASVASMMKHPAFAPATKVWSKVIPNPFLGITEENAEWYQGLKMHEKFALRWKAHMQEIFRLEVPMEIVAYEELVCEPDRTLARLQAFLNLEQPFPKQEMRTDSLDKWKDQLTYRQTQEIRVIGGLE